MTVATIPYTAVQASLVSAFHWSPSPLSRVKSRASPTAYRTNKSGSITPVFTDVDTTDPKISSGASQVTLNTEDVLLIPFFKKKSRNDSLIQIPLLNRLPFNFLMLH